jgi:transposase
VSGAHRREVTLLEPTVHRVVIPRPPPQAGRRHLCGDKGYAGAPAGQAVRARRYVPHSPQRGVEPQPRRRHPHGRARRWGVERTHSWLNRFRKLLVRFEKTAAGHEGLLEVACALIAYRQVISIYG